MQWTLVCLAVGLVVGFKLGAVHEKLRHWRASGDRRSTRPVAPDDPLAATLREQHARPPPRAA